MGCGPSYPGYLDYNTNEVILYQNNYYHVDRLVEFSQEVRVSRRDLRAFLSVPSSWKVKNESRALTWLEIVDDIQLYRRAGDMIRNSEINCPIILLQRNYPVKRTEILYGTYTLCKLLVMKEAYVDCLIVDAAALNDAKVESIGLVDSEVE